MVKRIVNAISFLTVIKTPQAFAADEKDILEIDNYKQGFKVQYSKSVTLGLGIAESYSFDKAGDVYTHLARLGGAIGIFPIVSSEVTFSSIVEDRNEITKKDKKYILSRKS